MKYNVDSKFIIDFFREIVEIPSPVGYYKELNAKMGEFAARFGEEVTFDNKSTAYIILEGEDNSKTVMVGAHLDTLGLMV